LSLTLFQDRSHVGSHDEASRSIVCREYPCTPVINLTEPRTTRRRDRANGMVKLHAKQARY